MPFSYVRRDVDKMNPKLSIHFNNGFFEYFCPNINNDTLTVEVPTDISGLNQTFKLYLEIWNGQWEITQSQEYSIYLMGKQINSFAINNESILDCQHIKSKVRFSIVIEEIFSGYITFTKYNLGTEIVSIGNFDDNTISYNCKRMVSGHHAEIEKRTHGTYIIDKKSTNGTFLNGHKVENELRLSFGDIIYIIGLKIVFLGDCIAINNPKDKPVIKGLQEYAITNKEFVKDKVFLNNEYYSRSPRHIEVLDTETIEIEAPPTPNKQRRQPLFMIIGPSITMVIPMFVGVLFTMWSIQQSSSALSSPFLYMGIITSITATIIGVFWALVNYRYSKKSEEKDEENRTTLYKKYLEKLKRIIENKQHCNKEALDKMYPHTGACLNWPNDQDRRLWERNVNHSDFLSVRLGIGVMKSPNEIIIPKEKFSLIDDTLADEPYQIKESYKYIKNVPISISLLEHNLIGVIGDIHEQVLDIARLMATQICAYHSYTDVKTVFIYNIKDEQALKFSKWLPHVWSQDSSLRMIATDRSSTGEVLQILSTVIRERLNNRENESQTRLKAFPHYIVFILSPEMVENEGVMKYLSAPKKDMGFTTVMLYDSIDRLPNNCTVIIQNDREYCGYYSLENSFESYSNVKFDDIEEEHLEQFARILSGIRVKELSISGAIPQMLTYLDMYKTSLVDSLNINKRWLQNRTYESMRAIIGYRAADTPLYLDIHEKYHGPHGLVAGTTGSGKSETLQTYILSLAINYHPYEISFILIDYKGGGMASSFEDLPHVAGIITNLGGNQTNRALASINSEIKRRQAVFGEYKIKHIDEYIKLFREGKADISIPHLIIIADEFAELKKEQPEFVRELVSASRVGRSLGVHLILATQKPSGVVDDEIWGNARFRICLRVQDKQDSNEMIKRPEAAYITSPGRGYFQVGNNEIFEEFQSGWSGAKYESEIPYSDLSKNDVKMISRNGKPCVIKSKKKNTQMIDEPGKSSVSQLSALVKYISDTAECMGISRIQNIWLPPLKKRVCLYEIESFTDKAFDGTCWKTYRQGGSINAVVGIADDPGHQLQMPLSIDLIKEGHVLICGSVGSGKTTFLQTILYSLLCTNSPDRVHIYIVDFGSRILGTFAAAPHTGGVVFDTEPDKAQKLTKLLVRELNRRKELFSQKGVGSYREYVRTYEDVPAIVFAIDNYASFMDNLPQEEDNMILLAREAASYGIYLILSTNNPSDIRSRVRMYFNYGLGLQMADKFEYEQVIGAKTQFVPEERIEGRGLARCPQPLEFQTAIALPSPDAIALNKDIKEKFVKMKDVWTGAVPKCIPQVPSDLSFSNFILLDDVKQNMNTKQYLPLYYDVDEALLKTLNLTRLYCYTISGGARTGKTNLLKVISLLCKQKGYRIYLFDGIRKELMSFANSIKTDGYMTSSEELFKFARDIMVPEFTKRNEKKAEYISQDRDNDENYFDSEEKICFFINDMTSFCSAVYESDIKLRLREFIETVFAKGEQHLFFFFATVSQIDYQNCSHRPLFRTFISYKEGLHLGGNVDQQKIFDFNISVVEHSKKLSSGYGHTIIGGRTVRIITPRLE